MLRVLVSFGAYRCPRLFFRCVYCCRCCPISSVLFCRLFAVTFSNLIGDIADNTPGADKFAITNAIGQDSRVGIKYLRPG